jgi:hypothetical protein
MGVPGEFRGEFRDSHHDSQPTTSIEHTCPKSVTAPAEWLILKATVSEGTAAMTLLVKLDDNNDAALIAKAQAQGISAEEFAARILDRELRAPAPAATATPRRHISEVIRERVSKIPAEVWKDFPTDGASEHDHYIYGLPKRNA